jgi:hypothetical protein
VQGIEVVNWANTLQFQNALNFREGMEQLIVVRLKQEASLTPSKLKDAQKMANERLQKIKEVEENISIKKKPIEETLEKEKRELQNAYNNIETPKNEVKEAVSETQLLMKTILC